MIPSLPVRLRDVSEPAEERFRRHRRRETVVSVIVVVASFAVGCAVIVGLFAAVGAALRACR